MADVHGFVSGTKQKPTYDLMLVLNRGIRRTIHQQRQRSRSNPRTFHHNWNYRAQHEYETEWWISVLVHNQVALNVGGLQFFMTSHVDSRLLMWNECFDLVIDDTRLQSSLCYIATCVIYTHLLSVSPHRYRNLCFGIILYMLKWMIGNKFIHSSFETRPAPSQTCSISDKPLRDRRALSSEF